MTIPADISQPFGNAPRNSVRGPMMLAGGHGGVEALPMPWPAGTLEFRAEFFNLLNRTNFRAPNGNRSSDAFGTITATYDPRIIQFGVRASF